MTYEYRVEVGVVTMATALAEKGLSKKQLRSEMKKAGVKVSKNSLIAWEKIGFPPKAFSALSKILDLTSVE